MGLANSKAIKMYQRIDRVEVIKNRLQNWRDIVHLKMNS